MEETSPQIDVCHCAAWSHSRHGQQLVERLETEAWWQSSDSVATATTKSQEIELNPTCSVTAEQMVGATRRDRDTLGHKRLDRIKSRMQQNAAA
jgi:hypothetical protein